MIVSLKFCMFTLKFLGPITINRVDAWGCPFVEYAPFIAVEAQVH